MGNRLELENSPVGIHANRFPSNASSKNGVKGFLSTLQYLKRLCMTDLRLKQRTVTFASDSREAMMFLDATGVGI